MGVISVSGFRTEPGRFVDHMGAAGEAIEHLRRLGMQAMTLQTIAGTDIGSISSVVNYPNNAAYATGYQKLMADEGFQEFWARAASGGSAQQAESSLYSDLDPSFQPSADRPLGAILVTQWRAKPGRLMDFIGNVTASIPHIERMGGVARTMQCLIGAYPMTTLVATSFANLDGYGEYADKTATDQQWQDFWGGVLSDPTADLVRSSLMLNVSDG